ncbi:Bcr/CflA family efflux MFS transporter [Aeromicrobium choanae]|uniref:MFS transporter, DHA1 family, bicyclomycin/chloramphenicol resistance protein n=1 Tax=Aeromicrobium choanae TaxID=1736691 RepID=A0A1T4YPS6_9ACTN|nr:Bcr/CflA family efflux MFS transporter [Aeromicrobium choanae]SKB03827.1 MFS transporter, DHA1 family, bicyclomycin/chloramphenicol resistance protein [Aeromicrobium choanae]
MTLTTTTPARSRPATLSTRRLALFAFIAAASPLAIDLYLASFPAIAADLRTTPAMVQLTLTAYIAGVAIGQPIWGPLSDRYGRRRPLVVSNALTLMASLVVVLAPTIETLVTARFVQALAAAAGMVVVRAMISDLTEGLEGVRALALMMTVHAVVPVVAPVLGGVLATVLPWRGVLGVFAAFVALQLVASVLLVRESLPPARRARRLSYLDLARVMRRGAFVVHSTTVGLAVGAVMTFIATSSFVYQEVLGLTPLQFGLSFGANACGMVAAGLLSARLARRGVRPTRTMAAGFAGAVSGGVLMIAAAASPWPVLLVGPVMAQVFFLNLVMSNGMGLAMAQARGLSGAGSAMLGFWMFGISALVTPLAGMVAGSRPEIAMAVVMTTLATAAGAVFCLGLRLAR